MAIAQLRRRGEMDRVWVLSALTLAGAAALYAGPVRGLAPLARPHLPWWLLAVAFAAGESAVVHLHFRRGAQTFSLGDFPLVFGLIFCSGRGVVVACLLGSGVALRIDRKLPWVKFVFNAAQFCLAACIADLVLHALASGRAPGQSATWIATLLATQAGGLVTVLLIVAAISITEARLDLRTVAEMFGIDTVVSITNSSLALCGVVMTALDPRAGAAGGADGNVVRRVSRLLDRG
jgi:hypothetical protein